MGKGSFQCLGWNQSGTTVHKSPGGLPTAAAGNARTHLETLRFTTFYAN